MVRQVCKRRRLQEKDQALHIQCETLKIINAAIVEGSAYTRTITNELFWEWWWWRLEDEKKEKIFYQLQTSIWKMRRWSKRKNTRCIPSPGTQYPVIPSITSLLLHCYKRHFFIYRGPYWKIWCGTVLLSCLNTKDLLIISSCNVKNKHTCYNLS